MQPPFERHFAVSGTFNIRDLGGYPHAAGETRWRRLLRADGLHRLDEAGMAQLTDAGVTTVIDLRRDHELESHPNPFSVNPSVAYHNVSLFDQLDPMAMVADVLGDLYVQALTTRHRALAEILTLIAEAPEDGVVLFHCTAGKDRTGLVAMLMLLLAGVEQKIILEDYTRTGEMIAPMIEEIIADATARGVDIESFRPLLACSPDTMEATLAHLTETHGSVEAYLAAIGLSPETIAKLKSRLVEDR